MNILKEKKQLYAEESEKVKCLLIIMMDKKMDLFNLKDCFRRLKKERKYLKGLIEVQKIFAGSLQKLSKEIEMH